MNTKALIDELFGNGGDTADERSATVMLVASSIDKVERWRSYRLGKGDKPRTIKGTVALLLDVADRVLSEEDKKGTISKHESSTKAASEPGNGSAPAPGREFNGVAAK